METFIRCSAALLPWVPVALFVYWSTAGVPAEATYIYTGIALVAAYTLTIVWTLLERWRWKKKTVPRLATAIILHALSPILPLLAAFFAQSMIRSVSALAMESLPVALSALALMLGFSLALSMWAWKSLAVATALEGVNHVIRR